MIKKINKKGYLSVEFIIIGGMLLIFGLLMAHRYFNSGKFAASIMSQEFKSTFSSNTVNTTGA